MNSPERDIRIIESLRIKPINHGQVHTFQIAIPKYQVKATPLERQEALKNSFIEHGSNLIPLIVRRTEDYSEEEEYEVVYGADWCLVAKELDIEKLWVWVFDMTDEQAAITKVEMEHLIGSSVSISIGSTTPSKPEELTSLSKQFESLLDQRIKPVIRKIDQLASTFSLAGSVGPNPRAEESESIYRHLEHVIYEALKPVATKINQLELGQQEIREKLSTPKQKKPQKTLAKVNLNTAEPQQLEDVPELGKKKVAEIIKLRDQKGHFQSLSELTQVRGISQRMVNQLRSYLVCE